MIFMQYPAMRHEWIRIAINSLRASGKTQKGLAVALGLAAPRVNEIINGTRRVQGTEVRSLAAYLEMEEAEVVRRLSGGQGGYLPTNVTPSPPEMGEPVVLAPVEVPSVGTLPRNLPVMGTAVCGTGDADFQLNGEISDYLRRPPVLDHVRSAFAVYVSGSSMYPRFEEGEPVFVNPSRPARIGDYVLCELHPTGEDGENPGPAYIKKLVKRTNEHIVLEQFNPAKEIVMDVKLVKRLYRILLPAELFGV